MMLLRGVNDSLIYQSTKEPDIYSFSGGGIRQTYRMPCSAFLISGLFRRALNELNINRFKEKDRFSKIDFAVLDRTLAQFNYRQFKRNFGY